MVGGGETTGDMERLGDPWQQMMEGETPGDLEETGGFTAAKDREGRPMRHVGDCGIRGSKRRGRDTGRRLSLTTNERTLVNKWSLTYFQSHRIITGGKRSWNRPKET